MATPAEVLADPRFHSLPVEERRKVMLQVDPRGFGALPAMEQDRVFQSAQPKPDMGGYEVGASESRGKHSLDTAPGWLPGPLKAPYGAVNAALGEGSRKMYEGLGGLWNEPTMERKAHSASQVLRGAGTAMAPALIPFAAASPIPTAIRLGAGMGAQKGVEGLANLVGAPEGYSELAGDVAGLRTAQKIPTSLPSIPEPPSGILKGAVTPWDLVSGVFHPIRTGATILGRIGQNVADLNKPADPFLFKPSSVTKSRMPTFVPGAEDAYSAPPGTIIPRKGFTPPPEAVPAPPEGPFAPGKATKRNMPRFAPSEEEYGAPGKIIPRGKFEAPPEPPSEPFAPFKPSAKTAKLVRGKPADNPYSGTPGRRIVSRGAMPEPPAEEGSITLDPAKVQEQIDLYKRKTEAIPEAKPEPIKPSELREPTTEAELHYSTHAVAKDLWGKSPHEPLRQLIEERYGKNRTQAFKNVPEGKTPLTTPERTDLLRHLLKKMPEAPGLKPPPK